MNVFHKITVETLKKNKTRTFVTIIGVILSTAMIMAVITFVFSIQSYMKKVVIEKEGDWYIRSGMMTEEKAEEIAHLETVSTAAKIQSIGYSQFENKGTGKTYFYFAGFSKEAIQMLNVSLLAGRMPENSNEVIISKYFQQYTESELEIGSEFSVTIGERNINGIGLTQLDSYYEGEEWIPREEKTYKVVGIFNRIDLENYSTPGHLFITVPEETKHSMELYLKIKNPKEIYSFSEKYLQEYFVIYHDELLRYLGVADNTNFYDVIQGLGVIILGLIICGSISLIYNAFSISVSERTKQFGLLSSIGATKKQRKKMILFEAVIISIIGIPLGIAAGITGIGITLQVISKGIKRIISSESQVQLEVVISIWPILMAAILAFITILISAWIPSIRSSRISTIDAIRQSNDIKISARQLKTSKLTSNIFKLEGILASKNYKRSRKKYRSTVISLVLSIVLFISSASFILYIKGSTSFVIGTGIGDLYYPINTDKEEAEEIYQILKQESHVTKSTHVKEKSFYLVVKKEDLNNSSEDEIINLETEAALNIRLGILSDEDFLTFAAEQKIKGDSYLEAEQLKGLVYDNIKYQNRNTKKYEKKQLLKTHDSIQFTIKNQISVIESEEIKQKEEEFLILAGDYISKLPMGLDDNPWSEKMVIIIPETQYQKFLQPYIDESSIWSTYAFQTTDYDAAYNGMEKLLAENNKLNSGFLYNYAQEVEGDKNTIMAVNVLSYGFIILISLIAVANVFNTVSTNFQLRRKEFAMLRSIGMSQKGFYRMMNYECILCGSKAILYGLPLAFIVTYSIYHVILSGVSIQFLIPWNGVITSVISVFLIVFLTMLYSMSKLRKENTIDALKNENI